MDRLLRKEHAMCVGADIDYACSSFRRGQRPGKQLMATSAEFGRKKEARSWRRDEIKPEDLPICKICGERCGPVCDVVVEAGKTPEAGARETAIEMLLAADFCPSCLRPMGAAN